MFFKNLQIYRLSPSWKMDAETLEASLLKKSFQPCNSQEKESMGWITPGSDERLVHVQGKQWLICLGQEQRLLPASVVRQEAQDRAELLAAQQGYKPGRKQMKELREAIEQEFLPRAFTRRKRVYAWIDTAGGWFVVDAPSPTRADDFIEVLRQSLDTLPLSLLRVARSPNSAMADWLAAAEAPPNMTIDQDCELRAISEEKAVVRYVRHNLDSDEVRAHIQAGKQPTRLALTWDDRLSFVLTDKLEIKRLVFHEVSEALDDQTGDEAAVFSASFSLMAGTLGQLIPAVVEALGGELAQAE